MMDLQVHVSLSLGLHLSLWHGDWFFNKISLQAVGVLFTLDLIGLVATFKHSVLP